VKKINAELPQNMYFRVKLLKWWSV